ncbi:MAG: hypothetical protein IT236_08330 [Bacteroidia bacterium]|nr:hypothetical protein [Bacteroidia bacterium]
MAISALGLGLFPANPAGPTTNLQCVVIQINGVGSGVRSSDFIFGAISSDGLSITICYTGNGTSIPPGSSTVICTFSSPLGSYPSSLENGHADIHVGINGTITPSLGYMCYLCGDMGGVGTEMIPEPPQTTPFSYLFNLMIITNVAASVNASDFTLNPNPPDSVNIIYDYSAADSPPTGTSTLVLTNPGTFSNAADLGTVGTISIYNTKKKTSQVKGSMTYHTTAGAPIISG